MFCPSPQPQKQTPVLKPRTGGSKFASASRAINLMMACWRSLSGGSRCAVPRRFHRFLTRISMLCPGFNYVSRDRADVVVGATPTHNADAGMPPNQDSLSILPIAAKSNVVQVASWHHDEIFRRKNHMQCIVIAAFAARCSKLWFQILDLFFIRRQWKTRMSEVSQTQAMLKSKTPP